MFKDIVTIVVVLIGTAAVGLIAQKTQQREITLSQSEAQKYCDIESSKGKQCDLTGIIISPTEAETEHQMIKLLEHDVQELRVRVEKLEAKYSR